MRSLRFLPLTFLAGVHGFVYFAPYLALFLAVAHFTRPSRRASLLPIPVGPMPAAV